MKILIFSLLFLCQNLLHSSEIITHCPFTIANTTINSLDSFDFAWELSLNSSNLTKNQLEIIITVINIALHNTTTLKWNYAENLNDGRGITFGLIGFTSGCFDGRPVIQKINKTAQIQNGSHVLASYYQAFSKIDNTEHDIYANTSNIEGLDNFIADFTKYGNDEISIQAQLDTINELYWQPAIKKAFELNVKHTSTMALFFDICLNHGCDGDGYNNKGLNQLINETNFALQGNLIDGYDERKWAVKLSEIRKKYMLSENIWNSSMQRAEIFRRLGDGSNFHLSTPFEITCVDNENHSMRKYFSLLLVILLFLSF